MIERIYLGNPFGWETETSAKVAISQLREASILNKCPKSLLLKNENYRNENNLLKFLFYLPILNVIGGLIVIAFADPRERSEKFHPDHKLLWRVRGLSMILTGPLLAIADLVKYLFDRRVIAKYNDQHRDLIEQFNVVDHHHNMPDHDCSNIEMYDFYPTLGPDRCMQRVHC